MSNFRTTSLRPVYPVGIMMWVGEKYNEISDPSLKDLQDRGFTDDILTTVCLYFFATPLIMTSMLCYYNNIRHEDYVDMTSRNLHQVSFRFSELWMGYWTDQRACSQADGQF